MKERPILFSTPMVQAIQAEIKDRTRRTRGLEKINKNPDSYQLQSMGFSEGVFGALFYDRAKQTVVFAKCPYGKVGDRLWVRETWTKVSVPDGTTARKILTLYKASMPAHGMQLS